MFKIMKTKIDEITEHNVFKRPELVAPEKLELTRNEELLLLLARIERSNEKINSIARELNSVERQLSSIVEPQAKRVQYSSAFGAMIDQQLAELEKSYAEGLNE